MPTNLVQRVVSVLMLAALGSTFAGAQEPAKPGPLRRTITYAGAEREYFVWLPPSYDRAKTYWPLVVVHGAGGNGRTFFMSTGISQLVAERRLDAIVISPSFSNTDGLASRFPSLGEGAFLQAVLAELRRDHSLRPKMLLTGYSRGGQFAHRIAMSDPEQVQAVAPFAAGAWTTPDGRFFLQGVGEVKNPRAFLSDSANAASVTESLRDLFQPRVAAVADMRAAAGAREVPFLVMCGTLDPRLPIAKQFVQSLETLGYRVQAGWPRTPHSCPSDACRTEFAAEFAKYPRAAVEFFQANGLRAP